MFSILIKCEQPIYSTPDTRTDKRETSKYISRLCLQTQTIRKLTRLSTIMSVVAHNVEEKERTEDVQIQENVDFSSMLLSDKILTGLQKCGFKKPSPIQLKAIPIGRCGFDLIVKAKSGTGKTAVFGVTALEIVNVLNNRVQVLILAPTREIAVQIQNVLNSIGSELSGLIVQYFIGGTPLQDDVKKLEKCHIAVGAPGRIKHLIDKKYLDVSQVKLFVLDEADKLLQNSYQTDINKIYHKLPTRKQMIAASATYPDDLDKFLLNYMTSPMHVSPDAKVPYLIGLKQFYTTVHFNPNVVQQMRLKNEKLTNILRSISFNQCLIFSNFQSRAESLSNLLQQEGWPSLFISGSQDQKTRLSVVDSLRDFKCRILSSTDLTARGIDAANVDLVINYDVPHDVELYLHRMGRAGRYGSHGICISIASEGQEFEKLQKIVSGIGGNVSVVKLPEKLASNIWEADLDSFEKLSTISGTSMFFEKINSKSISTQKDDEEISEASTSVQPETSDINEELFNKAVSQLTQLLTTLNKYEDNNGINNVAVVLSQIKTQNNMEQNMFFEKYKHINAEELLNGIENGTFSSKIEQDSKRIKLDDEDKQTLRKNIALFTITKCLTGQLESEENCIKCINELLEIIRMEDDSEKHGSGHSLQDFENCLKKNSKMKTKDVSQKGQGDLDQSNYFAVDSSTSNCKDFGCIENQVFAAYAYALSCGTTPHWNTICTEHESVINPVKKQEKLKENLLYNADEEMDVENYDEDYDENYFEAEDVDEEDTYGDWLSVGNGSTNQLTWQTEATEIDENLIVDAYKNALKADFAKPEIVETVCEPNENAPFGFAADTSYSRKRNVNFASVPSKKSEKPPEKLKSILKTREPETGPSELPFDIDLHDFFTRREKYKQYFKYYSNLLKDTAPKFDSGEEFQNWYKTWLQSLKTLREFVQHDIYEKEFRKKK